MSELDIELIYREVLSREEAKAFSPQIFNKQKSFIDDKAKFKSLLASRRAGKSTTAAVYLIMECRLNPNSYTHYVALTRKSAKNILWKELKLLNRQYNLKMTFNNTDLVADFENGSQIYLLGGNDEAAVETIRGMKSRLVILDEAASYRSHLKYLIEEVLTPMLIDYDGTLCLIGTPGAACAGPFFDATSGKDLSYSVHKWTILDNPFIPGASRWLADYRKAKGWDETNPVYLREWRGQWFKSSESQVYKYNPEVNDLKVGVLSGKMNHLIGVDIGYNDATAFVVGGWRDNDPNFYIVETFKKTRMTVDEIMEKLAELIKRFNPDKVVMDSGGGGKLVAASFRKRYSIPVKAAQKTDKRDFIEQMNSDFLSGRIKVLPGNQALTDEWNVIQWDEDYRREDERFICDLADACLYTWRESVHYTEQPLPEEPKVNTVAWNQREIELMEKAAEERYQRDVEEASLMASMYDSDDDTY